MENMQAPHRKQFISRVGIVDTATNIENDFE